MQELDRRIWSEVLGRVPSDLIPKFSSDARDAASLIEKLSPRFSFNVGYVGRDGTGWAVSITDDRSEYGRTYVASAETFAQAVSEAVIMIVNAGLL